ncbi:MAG TPA: type II CAAX endopeptidase family protein [Terriglobales bacterium]
MFTNSDGRLQPTWAFVFSAMLSVVAFLVSGYVAAAIAGDHVLRFEAIFRPLLVILLLAIFGWLLTVGNHVEQHRIAAQGLPLTSGWARQFALGCGIGLLLVLMAVIPIAVLGSVRFRVIVNTFNMARVAIVLGVLIAGALAEELMFRGYPFQRLVEGIGATGAIGVFSVLFGVVHLSNPGATVWGLVNTVAIGILLAIAYLRTKALWLPWGIHFAWNAMLGLVLGLPVSGLRLFNVAVHATAIGPKWLTGGSYGIEASASGAFAVVAGLVAVWKLPLSPMQNPASLSPTENQVEPGLPNVTN